jgi:hypothetical protein
LIARAIALDPLNPINFVDHETMLCAGLFGHAAAAFRHAIVVAP